MPAFLSRVAAGAGLATARRRLRVCMLWPLALCAAQAAEPAPAPRSVPAAAEISKGVHGLTASGRRADGTWLVTGTLSGNGVIALPGTRVISGKVAPGNSPGCVTDQGNVIFDAAASLEIEIGGATACTQFDSYSVGLSLTLNAPTLNVLLINGFLPIAGQRFKVLSWGSLSGTFGKVNLPALGVGLSWDTSALYTAGELAVAGPASSGDVPLPPWALGGLGLTVLVALYRRAAQSGA
jgi:hypothetical protein